MATSLGLASVLLIAVATLQVALATYYYPPCDPPRYPDYGGYSPYGSSKYPIGSKVKYYCNDGYTLYGSLYTTCKYNKQSYWTHSPPVCRKPPTVTCPPLKDPPYGSVKVTGRKPGSIARYDCDKHSKLIGDDTRKCLYNGYWSGKEPVCKSILCPPLDDPPYGSVKVSSRKPGSIARYECDKHFKLVGDDIRKCLYNGYWSGKEPVCKPIPLCPPLKDPPYGSVKVSGRKPGSIARYDCDKHTKLIGDDTRKCLYNGYWSGKEPVCKPILCPPLKDPLYGSVKVSSRKPGSIARYECDKHFKLVGDDIRKCLYNGYWSGKEPVCKSIPLCPPLDDPPYGSVKVSGRKPGSIARYDCDKHFKLVGDDIRKCLYNGYWSGKEPVCKPILCPPLDDPPYGSVKVSGRKPGSIARYDCDKHFKLVGDDTRKCLYNGYWSGKEPVCKKIVCPHPKPIPYGKVRADTYHPTSKAYYSCDRGYELRGTGYRTCLYTGVWDGKPPVCHKKIVCPHLDHPQYGYVKVDGYTPGSSRAYYSCNNGYERYGRKYRKCLSDGSWYGKAPTCRPRKYY